MIDDDALDATLLVTRALDDLGVAYVIGGSVASTVHGTVRTTVDVDILVALRAEVVDAFAASLGEAFYYDVAAMRAAIARGASFNLIHLQSMTKLDLFVAGERAFDRQQLARRLAETVTDDAGAQLWVLSAEDIILAKLDWYRQGGEVSERQWRDVLGVMKTQGSRLDAAYLAHWADVLGVADLLVRAQASL